MNDLSQAPKDNLMLEALLARIERICNDKYLPHDERLRLALQTAEATTSLVAHARGSTITKVDGKPLPPEQCMEELFLQMHDGSTYTFPIGLWVER